MVKVKTKSGFSCEINENKIGSWNMIDYYTKINKAAKAGDEGAVMTLTADMYVFILGEDSYNALLEHLKDEDGIVTSEALANEYKEILSLAKVKKSKSSQA